MLGEISHQLRF